MFFKVISIALLLSICAAENRILLPKRVNAQSLPSHRYNRFEIPQYKYGEIQHYSTHPPKLRPQPLLSNFQRIQYAPLQNRNGQNNKNAAVDYNKIHPTLSSTFALPTESYPGVKNRNTYGKDHLEPRVAAGQERQEQVFKCYQGHKPEAWSSVSRSPGHNAVYRSFPDQDKTHKVHFGGSYVQQWTFYGQNYDGDKRLNVYQAIRFPCQVNNVRPYGVYQNFDALSTTMLPLELTHEKLRPFAFASEHYILNPNIVDGDSSAIKKIKRQYSPYSKYHRLHLNIARVYSPGEVPQKSPVFADTYSLNLGDLPLVHSQGYVPPVFHVRADQKTKPYQMKGRPKKYRFHLS